jgi:tRNA threonylcarbamoyladenosine biosynthesis protein TsaB
MIYLAIDTATESCSAALWVDGKMYSRQASQARMHAELILPFIDELLEQAQISKADIDGLILGIGPGAFTGVRIAVAVAQGIALALNIKVVPVSNLQTLAYKAYQQLDTEETQKILVATDARMQEVYCASFEVNPKSLQLIGEETVCKPELVPLNAHDAYIGSGFSTYDVLQQYQQTNPMPFDTNVFSHAEDMLLMVKDQFDELSQDIQSVEPIYLRNP